MSHSDEIKIEPEKLFDVFYIRLTSFGEKRFNSSHEPLNRKIFRFTRYMRGWCCDKKLSAWC